MNVVDLDDPQALFVKKFFDECRAIGYANNCSKKMIKFDWATLGRKGKFWAVLNGGRMIGMSGCHWMPEIHDNAFRILFRGCELPGTDLKKTLSKSQFNSFNFREVLPHQLAWIKRQLPEGEPFITTDHSNRNHRAMQLLAKQGLLQKHDEGIYFHTAQTVWKFNESKYFAARSKIKTYTSESL